MVRTIAISLFVPLLIAVNLCEARSQFAESEFNPATLKINEDDFLGKRVPDITITNEANKKISLRSLTNRPLILLMIYYDCPIMCPLLGEGLAGALENMKDLKLGSEYNVLVLSFNKDDNTEKAIGFHEKLKKSTSFPDVAKWVFATAKEADIKALTEATGYRFFVNQDNMFVHPSVYIFLSPERKITRYIWGVKPDAFTLRLAILESAKGLTGKVPISSLLTLACYKYNSESHGYMLNILFLFESVGVFMGFMVGILSFIVYRKRKNLRRG